jgi:hypothetical protein
MLKSVFAVRFFNSLSKKNKFLIFPIFLALIVSSKFIVKFDKTSYRSENYPLF